VAIEYPELLRDGGEFLARRLEALGLEPEQAADTAFACMEDLRSRWGGAQIYIPKANHLDLSERDARIFEDWRKGEDLVVLMRRYDLTIQRIRFIVRAGRLARRQKTSSPALFPEAD